MDQIDNDQAEEAQQTHEDKKEKQPKKQKDKKAGFSETIKDYKAEFKKIVWPSRPETVKKTFTVVVTSILIGLIIFGMDTVFTTGLQFVIGFIK